MNRFLVLILLVLMLGGCTKNSSVSVSPSYEEFYLAEDGFGNCVLFRADGYENAELLDNKGNLRPDFRLLDSDEFVRRCIILEYEWDRDGKVVIDSFRVELESYDVSGRKLCEGDEGVLHYYYRNCEWLDGISYHRH